MWTIDMGRCMTCPIGTECEDRKKLLQTMSPMVNELNQKALATPDKKGGKGVIIVSCR